ncbi:MAG: small subunit ribosomal protein S8e [Candidatus Woesearchaeota archaeon]|jgi:small subunit ribosomal protein S8e
MAIDRTTSLRKATGGRKDTYRKSRQYAKVNKPILTKIGTTKARENRTIGGGAKFKLIAVNKISVADPKKKTVTIADVKDVIENGANRNFIIRDIINKGAILETSAGKVRVTSRPGQTGALSGVIVE